MPMDEEIKVKSLQKAMRVLECFLEHKEMGISEIAARLGLYKSSVYNIVSTFEAMDYLRQNPDTSRYSLGVKLCEYSRAISDSFSVSKIALPYMQEIANRVREHVYLGQPYQDEVLYLEAIHPIENIEMMRSLMGLRVKMYCTGLGKALMAFLPPERVNLCCREPLKRFTDNTITDPVRLKEELALIRSRGYAVDDMEHEYGIKCVGVPIFDKAGQVCAAMSVSGPSLRFGQERILELAQMLKEYAYKIQLGIY